MSGNLMTLTAPKLSSSKAVGFGTGGSAWPQVHAAGTGIFLGQMSFEMYQY